MKKIYITAIPLDSNFLLQPLLAQPVNYRMHVAPFAVCFPITQGIADTAQEGDEVKVIAVRQKNNAQSKNLAAFRQELDALGLSYTLTDLTMDETQQKDELLGLFEALIRSMEGNACYYACMTFGTKTYPLVLSSALHYAEKVLDTTQVKGIYYREITRENGAVKSVAQYDVSALFTLDSLIDLAAQNGIGDKAAFIGLLLHPDQGV